MTVTADFVTRGALLILFGVIVWRSVRIRRTVYTPARRRSLGVMAFGAILPMVFWFDVMFFGSSLFARWLSRLAFASLAVTLITLQAFIRDADYGQ